MWGGVGVRTTLLRTAKVLAVLLLPVLLGACTAAPSAEEARTRTAQLVADVGVASLPAEVGVLDEEAGDVEGCVTQRTHRVAVTLDAPDEAVLIETVEGAWSTEDGELSTIRDGQEVTLALDDGYRLVLSVDAGPAGQTTLVGHSPCFGSIAAAEE